MSDQDFAIYRLLLDKPGMMYVAPDRRRVALLNGKNEMYVFGGDFAGKTDAEINQIVCVMMDHKH